MWVLLDDQVKKMVATVGILDEWCHKKRYTDPEDPKFGLLVYAEGLRDGMARVLEAAGVKFKWERPEKRKG